MEKIDRYLNKSDWEINENCNQSYSLQGLNNYVAAEASKQYWLQKLYTEEIHDAVALGEFHIHDMQSLSSYCVGWDLQDIIKSGFKGGLDKIESKPAKHFGAILGQLVNAFYTLQGETAGAQAVSNFDTLLAPFIRYDNLTYEQTKQALQEFLFNMNVPTRVGFQTPFTNVTLDLVPPSTLANEPVIIGGKPQDTTYREFQHEIDIFNRAFAGVLSEGDAKGRVFTFPIPTYNITKDFDWDNENLEGLWKMTAKYGIPYFSNFINSDMKPEDARSMCCRLRLDNRELQRRGGGLFGANPLTGSIGVVTMNLARAGYLTNTKKDFYDRLAHNMDLAKESLEQKRILVEKFTETGLYPYSKFYLRTVKKRFDRYWANHFSTIGLIGMNEACLNLLNQNLATPEGKQFARDVLDFMRTRIRGYQEETGNLYNLEATPAEGTSYRLAKKDKEQFPDIIVANEKQYKEGSQEPYYTNSSHLAVDYTRDVFELLDHQDDLQTKYTGGTVVHLFLGEAVKDINTVKSFVRTVCTQYKLPYFTLTPTFSVCYTHGYQVGKQPACLKCGETNDVYSRVVGFIRPVRQWNIGKKAEFQNRNTYNVEQQPTKLQLPPITPTKIKSITPTQR